MFGGMMCRLSDQNLIRLNSDLPPVLYTRIPTSATFKPRARKFVQEIKRDLGGATGRWKRSVRAVTLGKDALVLAVHHVFESCHVICRVAFSALQLVSAGLEVIFIESLTSNRTDQIIQRLADSMEIAKP